MTEDFPFSEKTSWLKTTTSERCAIAAWMRLDLPLPLVGEGFAFPCAGTEVGDEIVEIVTRSAGSRSHFAQFHRNSPRAAGDTCSVRIQEDQQDLDRAIRRYGYNSVQAQHEQGELERDAANCGYDIYGHRSYRDRDDWRYRSGVGYNEDYSRGYGDYDAAFDHGYRDVLAMGERDAPRNRAFRPKKNDWYEDADRGYNGAYGNKRLYKHQYREPFEQGYLEGYRQWR